MRPPSTPRRSPFPWPSPAPLGAVLGLVVLLLLVAPAGPAAAQETRAARSERPDGPSVTEASNRALAAAALWDEEAREFFLDGPAWLLPLKQRLELAAMGSAERGQWIESFLAGGGSGGPGGERVDPAALEEAIARRRALMRAEHLSPLDVRARLLFLQGPPDQRLVVDCGTTFKPSEIWSWNTGPAPEGRFQQPDYEEGDRVLVYQELPGEPWRLWVPHASKRVLYTSEMEYYLEQYEEFKSRIVARRFDLQVCPNARAVDEVTGVDGLFGFEEDRRTASEYTRFVEPPRDLAAWVEEARTTPLPPEAARLLPGGERAFAPEKLEVLFPAEDGQRLTARLRIHLPAGAPLEATAADRVGLDEAEAPAPVVEERLPALAGVPTEGPVDEPGPEVTGIEIRMPESSRPDPAAGAETDRVTSDLPVQGDRELRLVVEGLLEQGHQIFETFRVRFVLPAPEEPRPLVLVLEEPLRPGEEFLLRLRVSDEVGGAAALASVGFRVPDAARPEDLPPVPEDAIVAMAQDLASQGIQGEDSLLLVPPTDEVVVGLWRAEALVSGERITKVRYSVDGVVQLTDGRAPYSAEVRLAQYPVQQVIRAEGLDSADRVVAADEVIVNQPRGALAVRITEPARGAQVNGEIEAAAEVVVPEGRRVERVEFEVDGEVVAERTRAPWTATVTIPQREQLSYLAVRAILDDGLSAEDVRLLNVPDYVEELDVDLVELYVAVTDRSGRPVRDLTQEEFTVLDEGRPQEISKFELVDNLPLTVGITIDASGSMAASLAQAQAAAREFLEGVITPRDRAFAVAFSDRPSLLMTPTRDIGAVVDSFESLQANGWTALHDAVVTSLYYFRGFTGQRALILLSDGEDTASSYDFDEALEYARRSGVAIYSVGLDISAFDTSVRRKLSQLAEETGGRAFFISQARELSGVYREIEEELRSRYLLAFSPASGASGDELTFREVEVEVKRRGLEARTAKGYYQ